MDGITRYRTTDLELYSDEDPTAFAAALDVLGFRPWGVTRFASGGWYCGFNLRSEEQYDEPEPEIAALLAVIEALDPSSQSAWVGCSLRVFDIGYDCGREPFAFRQELSAKTLSRLAAASATLRVTLYADPGTSPASDAA